MSQTNIILILLADENTKGDVDNLLRQVQTGVGKLAKADMPEVYCLYRRPTDPDQGPRTFSYPVNTETPTFNGNDLVDYPPQPPIGVERTGPLVDQINQFLKDAYDKLPADRKVQVIIAAHGTAARGFNPKVLQLLMALKASDGPEAREDAAMTDEALLESIRQLLNGPFDEDLKQLKVNERFRALLRLLTHTDPKPGYLTPELMGDEVSLSLDEAEKAFEVFESGRLKTLLLHSCQMSGIETMCALRCMRHHIAFQTHLSGTVSISKWFSTFANAGSTDDSITKECFTHLKTMDQSAFDCCSSHRTELTEFLKPFNSIGTQLLNLIDVNDPDFDQNRKSIECARLQSLVDAESDAIDLAFFCNRLEAATLIKKTEASDLKGELEALQFPPAPLKHGWTVARPEHAFQGVSVFLPKNGKQTLSVDKLPDSFQTMAEEWCSFLDAWQKLPNAEITC